MHVEKSIPGASPADVLTAFGKPEFVTVLTWRIHPKLQVITSESTEAEGGQKLDVSWRIDTSDLDVAGWAQAIVPKTANIRLEQLWYSPGNAATGKLLVKAGHFPSVTVELDLELVAGVDGAALVGEAKVSTSVIFILEGKVKDLVRKEIPRMLNEYVGAVLDVQGK